MRTVLCVLCLVLAAPAVGQITTAEPGDDLAAKLAEAESGGGHLLLAKGTYVLNQPLVVTSTVTISGAGREATRFCASSDFVGDALIELVAGQPGNLRGIVLRGLGTISGSASPDMRCAILIARDTNNYGSYGHTLEDIHVGGRFAYAFVVIGGELCALRDCSCTLVNSGAVGLYACHTNYVGFFSTRLGKIPAGGQCSWNRVYGGAYGPGPGGYCVRLDGGIRNWLFTGTFFGSNSAGAEAAMRLHGMGTRTDTQVPEQLTLVDAGNDCPRSTYGLLVTTEREDRVGAAWLTLTSCQFNAVSDPLRREGNITHGVAVNCRWRRNWVGEEVTLSP